MTLPRLNDSPYLNPPWPKRAKADALADRESNLFEEIEAMTIGELRNFFSGLPGRLEASLDALLENAVATKLESEDL